jgi:heptosyltransferase-3
LDFFIPDEAKRFVKKVFEENNIPPHPPLSKGGQRGVKVVHIHPTSRWLFKCWKDEYMAEVIRWLIDKGITVIVTSSPDRREMEKAKNILSLVDELTPPHIPPLVRGGTGGVIDLCGKTTIKQLAAVADSANVFIGVDSAPMHIAAAVGTTVIAIFGAGEQSWKPWGKGHVVLFKDEVSRTGVSRNERIQRNLSKIKPEDVIKEVKRLLFPKSTK